MGRSWIDAQTGLCAVIGRPVSHSLSPAIHNAAFEARDLNLVYLAFEVGDLKAFLDGMLSMKSFRGLSVTIPHKRSIMEHLDEVDALALKVGSVNTVVNRDGRLLGSTTDGPGTLRAFDEAGVSLAGKRVTFLGTGGAVRAVAFAVADQGFAASMRILGRTERNVRQLVSDLNDVMDMEITGGDLSADIEETLPTHDVVIQGTPVGMESDSPGESCVPGELLRGEHVVFDMVYRPLRTRLVCDAEAAGCRVVLGREMLIHQAALQFELWTGEAAPLDAMRAAFDGAV